MPNGPVATVAHKLLISFTFLKLAFVSPIGDNSLIVELNERY